MKRHLIAALFLIFSGAFHLVSAQKLEYIKIPELEKLLNNNDTRLYVINFWATWCAPCVSELPEFEKVARDYDSKKVRFILLSLDFPSQIEKQLVPFLKKNKISLEVAVMMETDSNLWIDKIDSSWQGNIPSTLFLNNPRKIRYFHTEAIDEQGLRKIIDSFL